MLVALLASIGLLTSKTPPVNVPLQIFNNHVVVNATLDGAGPFRFIVDSGAGNVVDTAVAAAIGARQHGRIELQGVGSAAQTGTLTTIRRVAIGGKLFTNQRFVVTATRATFAAAEGPAVDGLIGRQIIGAGITVIDYARRTLTFDAGQDNVTSGGATVLPATSADGEPRVPCRIGAAAPGPDVDGICAIDTGSRLNVTILAPFVKAHPGLVPAFASAVGVDGYGIGGAVYGRLGRLRTLTLGTVTLGGVSADFSVAERGAFASPRTAANIGGGVLRRFTLTFDLAHGRIALRPNDDFFTPDITDRSGLFLVERAGKVTVLDVRPRTPAQRAGILRGDRIVAAAGRSIEPDRLPQLRALLDGPADARVALTIARAGTPLRTIDVRLGDYQ